MNSRCLRCTAAASAFRSFLPSLSLLASLTIWTSVARSAETTNQSVRATAPGRFQIGNVSLDKTNRTVSFPAAVNMREADLPVEYAVVHHRGKTHESILRTETRPHDIQMALLLLGAQPTMTNSFGASGKEVPTGERITIEVVWTNDGRAMRCALEDLVTNKETSQTMTHGEWIFNGSNFSEGVFNAERDGSIVSIHIDPGALINNPRPGRENDDLHVPNPTKLPPVGHPVEVRFKLNGPAKQDR
jgi:hypothetical protein